MNDKDYIRKAVELADVFQIIHDATIYCIVDNTWHVHLSDRPPVMLDALAAQLVRQVDTLDGVNLISTPNGVDVYLGTGFQSIKTVDDDDRTMNTIKAIVDSGVLSE